MLETIEERANKFKARGEALNERFDMRKLAKILKQLDTRRMYEEIKLLPCCRAPVQIPESR